MRVFGAESRSTARARQRLLIGSPSAVTSIPAIPRRVNLTGSVTTGRPPARRGVALTLTCVDGTPALSLPQANAYGSTSPRRIAYRTISTRSRMPSFPNTFVRCDSTVFSESFSVSAICLLV